MPRVPQMGEEALFPRVTISDLVIFHDAYPLWLDHKPIAPTLQKYHATKKTWQNIWGRLAGSLGCASGAELKKKCREGPLKRSPADVFWEGIPRLLQKLRELAREARERGKRVVIEGSEFGILWLLPRVLAGSRWLEDHAETELDIRQSAWREYLTRLERGEADLCLGTECSHTVAVQAEVVLILKRWLIYPKGGTYQPPKEGLKNLEALKQATMFVLAGDISPSLARVNEMLPRPEPPGRRIYVQSVAHLYQYARQGLGMAIGYDPYFGTSHSPLAAVPILDARMEPARITLYRPAKALLSAPAESLHKAIREVSQKIQKKLTS